MPASSKITLQPLTKADQQTWQRLLDPADAQFLGDYLNMHVALSPRRSGMEYHFYSYVI